MRKKIVFVIVEGPSDETAVGSILSHKIIHLVDMDGAYVPEEAVVADPNRRHIRYYENQIRTPDRDSILERNARKRKNLNKLIREKEMWKGVPYQVYYMSCNLDHVLYGELNMPDSNKVDAAYDFASRYRRDPEAFVEYMTDSPFSVDGNFRETWDYIRSGTRSLQRHSNLHLALTSPTP